MADSPFMTPASAPLSENQSLRAFFISISLAVAVCISGAFLGIALRGRTLIREEMLNRARTDFRTLVQFRAWNASYGGVYVEKHPGTQSNPYLDNPDIQCLSGKVYTNKNPALMARELSERLKQSDGYSFHITSLNPLNPGNKADPEETQTLRAFERGEKERTWNETIGGRNCTRYMAPLVVDQSCLGCHASQGYKIGDIRGGISFSYDTQEIQVKLRKNLLLVCALALLTTGLLLGLVGFFFRQLVRELAKARHQLETFAMTDPLTGLFNRRQILQRFEQECERANRGGEGLSCIMLDIDHFKQVNDTFGHQVGDDVLQKIASLSRLTLRAYDDVGRYGGEEFVAILPRTSLDTAQVVAERLRTAIETADIMQKTNGDRHLLTASLGLSQWKPFDTVDTMIQRADQALYRAKVAGRNRIEIEDA
jgi:diguanylate cyclase (GGDEF)-like protein